MAQHDGNRLVQYQGYWVVHYDGNSLVHNGGNSTRMGIAQAVVMNMERREAKKTVSLSTLERAAAAMNCKLVYAIVPIDESLEKTLDKQSFKAAAEIAKATTHSMSLENQSVQLAETHAQIQDLATELKLKGDRRICAELKATSD